MCGSDVTNNEKLKTQHSSSMALQNLKIFDLHPDPQKFTPAQKFPRHRNSLPSRKPTSLRRDVMCLIWSHKKDFWIPFDGEGEANSEEGRRRNEKKCVSGRVRRENSLTSTKFTWSDEETRCRRRNVHKFSFSIRLPSPISVDVVPRWHEESLKSVNKKTARRNTI